MPYADDLDRINHLCFALAEAYYAHHAAMMVVAHPDAKTLLPEREPGRRAQIGRIRKADGDSAIEYLSPYYLDRAARDADDYGRIWLAGAILKLGDEIKRAGLPRTPEVEWVRHVRNAIAHGNCFRIDHPAELDEHPAYIPGRYDDGSRNEVRDHEIVPDLDGKPFLFEFVGEAELVSVFQVIGMHLASDWRIEVGAVS